MLSTCNLNEVHSYLISSPQQCEVQLIWKCICHIGAVHNLHWHHSLHEMAST